LPWKSRRNRRDLRLALSLDGFRLAEAGEFSLRAFENGKLDLIQAEGIADIIDASTSRQLIQATRFVAGDASERITAWRSHILKASAFIAASIDFSDEGDVGENPHGPAITIIESLITELGNALKGSRSAARIRDGIRIAILGEPNVGKSTLMNALAERDAAIVSDIAGTTRDVLETHLVLNGIPVTLADTAGLRETDDPIEAEGVRRARAWAEKADLRLYLAPSSSDDLPADENIDLYIGTKSDLVESIPAESRFDICISVKNRKGLDALRNILSEKIRSLTETQEAPSIVRLRHQDSMATALDALNRAKSQLNDFDDVDLAGFELSIARSALDQILGRVDVEDILGEVFSGFCVGK
jgi:tRNA modification GTPase